MSFFKFKPKDNKIFQIATSTPPKPNKYNKKNQIDFSLNKNIDVLKDLLHFPDSNDLIFRFFDININNQKYNALLILYDGLVDSNLINNYLIKQLLQNVNLEVIKNKSIIKNKNTLDIKDIIVRQLTCRMSS